MCKSLLSNNYYYFTNYAYFNGVVCLHWLKKGF